MIDLLEEKISHLENIKEKISNKFYRKRQKKNFNHEFEES